MMVGERRWSQISHYCFISPAPGTVMVSRRRDIHHQPCTMTLLNFLPMTVDHSNSPRVYPPSLVVSSACMISHLGLSHVIILSFLPMVI
jgi:hypothetical protein